MLPSGELIGMCHMICQVMLKQYGCLTCASYKDLGCRDISSTNFDTFLLLHRFLKIVLPNI